VFSVRSSGARVTVPPAPQGSNVNDSAAATLRRCQRATALISRVADPERPPCHASELGYKEAPQASEAEVGEANRRREQSSRRTNHASLPAPASPASRC